MTFFSLDWAEDQISFLFFLEHFSLFVHLSKETFLCSSAINMQYSALSLQRSTEGEAAVLVRFETVILFSVQDYYYHYSYAKCCFLPQAAELLHPHQPKVKDESVSLIE